MWMFCEIDLETVGEQSDSDSDSKAVFPSPFTAISLPCSVWHRRV